MFLRFELHICAGEHSVEDFAIIVGSFSAVNQWAAFDGEPVAVGPDGVVGNDFADRHRQFQRYHVAPAPTPFDGCVPFVEGDGNGLSIDGECGGWSCVIAVAIKVAGHRLIARPAGDADVERERCRLVRADGQFHRTVPRIAGFLTQLDPVSVNCDSAGTSDEEVNVEGVTPGRVDVTGNRRDEAHDVNRAARATKPRTAFALAAVFERVRIKEPVAGKGNTAEKSVVNDALEYVHILRVAMQQEHALIPERVGDGGAGFVVGAGVGQFVVVAERFAAGPRADAAGKVEFFAGDVIPKTVDGGDEFLVTGQRGDVGDAAVEVTGADGVADSLILLGDRFVVLLVRRRGVCGCRRGRGSRHSTWQARGNVAGR